MSYGQLQRWRAVARSSVVSERDKPPRRTFEFADIEPGWLVEDCDHARLGIVLSSGDSLLRVSRGRLSRPLLVPPSAIAEVHEGAVRLNVARRWIDAQRWDGAGSRNQR